MKRNISEIITRMSTIAILSALGTVIMLFIKIPYFLAPWLEIEFSDTIILVAYALYGIPGALSTALIKTMFSFIFQGVGFLGIGQIAALISSFSYILGIYIFSHVLKWFKKGIKYRILSYVFIAILVTFILTLVNIIFITPTYMAGEWATCFSSGIVSSIESTYSDYGSSFILIMIVIYVPFNLFKAFIVQFVYEIVFNRLIFVIFKNNAFVQKYFIGSVKSTKVVNNVSDNKRHKKGNSTVSKDQSDLSNLLDSCKKDEKESK